MGFHPPEPFPSAKPYASRRLYPLAVSDIVCSCSEDQEITMPRSFRALLPAEIRTRLEFYACRPMLSWAFSLSLNARPGFAKAGGPTSARRARRGPKTSSTRGEPKRNSRGRSRGNDRRSKSCHQDLSPGSPDDSSVLSDCSD